MNFVEKNSDLLLQFLGKKTSSSQKHDIYDEIQLSFVAFLRCIKSHKYMYCHAAWNIKPLMKRVFNTYDEFLYFILSILEK